MDVETYQDFTNLSHWLHIWIYQWNRWLICVTLLWSFRGLALSLVSSFFVLLVFSSAASNIHYSRWPEWLKVILGIAKETNCYWHFLVKRNLNYTPWECEVDTILVAAPPLIGSELILARDLPRWARLKRDTCHAQNNFRPENVNLGALRASNYVNYEKAWGLGL